MKKRVLIIGANSDIALSAGRLYLDRGHQVLFAAHKPDSLPDWAQPRLKVDMENTEEAIEILKEVVCDILMYSAGKLASNEACSDPVVATAVLKVNFSSPSVILPLFAAKMKARGNGVIVGISSVAGDRGKASHYLYGASKAGFDYLLAGLRQELHDSSVRVLTIRPGYVHTKMIAGVKTSAFLTSTKEKVAEKIVRNSLQGSRNIIYVKAIWRPIMWILRHIPEALFKRKKL